MKVTSLTALQLKKRRREKRRRHMYNVGGKGLMPGTPVFVGEQKLDAPSMDITCYTAETLDEVSDATLEDFNRLTNDKNVTWLNVNGVHDISAIEAIGQYFNLHPLTLEDIVNTTQRPKAEEFDDYIFLVLKMAAYNEAEKEIEVENVSLVLGKGYVISFQEREGDVFGAVRTHIRSAKGRIRKSGADYLVYSLMDAVVDEYFAAIEKTGERIEDMDDDVILDPRPAHVQEIHHLKRNVLFLRKSVWPLREEVAALEKSDSKLIEKPTRAYLRDLYDHTIQVIDMVETYRDILGGLHDTYLSSVNNRMNDIMKVLTIIATIFIPLTFIAGVYGMNFKYMPELEWKWGYFASLAIMAVMALGMLVYFKRKGWFKANT